MSVRWVEGHVWCDTCDKAWKQCPCPGAFRAEVVITKELIDSVAPQMNAFLKEL